MSWILNFLYGSIISHCLLAIIVTLLSFLLLKQILSWIRVWIMISRLPGPKSVPVFGNGLSLIGDGERKSNGILN